MRRACRRRGGTSTARASPTATAPIYVEDGPNLYTWDPATLALAAIAPFTEATSGSPLTGMTDLAIDREGHLYGAYGAAIYRIDPTTAACSYVRDAGEVGTGLTFLPDGRLLVAGASLLAVDLQTGEEATLVGAGTWTTSGDIVAIPDGTLQWSVRGYGSDVWVEVNPTTGATRALGNVGASDLWGVAWAADTLYGLDAQGSVWEIDPVTGAGTLVQTGTVPFAGATTNPVTW